MTKKMIFVFSVVSVLTIFSEAMAQYPYAVPVRPRVASKMAFVETTTPVAEVVKAEAVKTEEVQAKSVPAVTSAPEQKQQQQQQTAQTVQARPVAPTKVHTGYTRAEIRSMPILERPNRPGHFYGNTVRRRAGVYNY